MNKLLVSRSGDGRVNLAQDEYILEKYRSGEFSGVTLYFYVNTNDVIIGRNQNAWLECAMDSMNEDGVRLVRRHTGGGAVFHDEGNLNFSFITDEKHYDKALFSSVVLAACARFGIAGEATGRNDLLADGRKFSGCAFALSGRARGMHGTLLVSADLDKLPKYLSPSKKKLMAKGIASVRSRVVNLSELAPVTVEALREAVIEEFIRALGPAEPLAIGEEARNRIDQLTEKNRSWDWLFGVTPAFDVEYHERLSFGEIRLGLSFGGGRIRSVSVSTDALDAGLPAELSRLLTGVRYDAFEMAEALRRGGQEARELADYIEGLGN